MDEAFPPSDQNELSPEDQAVLDAFLAMEDTEEQEPALETSSGQVSVSQQAALISEEEDMLILFATEAAEDIAGMRRAVARLEQDEHRDSPAFDMLHRTAHKLKGTAGAIGFDTMSAIARHIETTIELIRNRDVVYIAGMMALAHAVQALETILEGIITDGQENTSLLKELEAEYAALSRDKSDTGMSAGATENKDSALIHGADQAIQDQLLPVRNDIQHLDQLILHTEHMLEQHAPLENAQKQVEIALQELHNAQVRLRRLETLYKPFALNAVSRGRPMREEQVASSLVERILRESVQRTGHLHKLKAKSYVYQPPTMHEIASWDEMEIDRFKEPDVLAHSLSEAIADVATATTQLRLALAQMNTLISTHMAHTVQIHNEAISLRSIPFNALVARLKSAAQMLTASQKRTIQFEVSGESTEIDQDILEALTNPFLELVRGCVTESLLATEATQHQGAYAGRIRLNARFSGNEVHIEAGFSMSVPGGIVEKLSNSIHHLHGSVTPQRGPAERITFHLRFPRSQGTVQGLLVRAGNQSVIVPFFQVHHIDFAEQEQIAERYDLNTLLGFLSTRNTGRAISPWLVLQEQTFQLAVHVDDIIGQVDMVMKPLAEYLRRPGIMGTAIDGSGNIVLVVNLPELVMQRDMVQRQKEPVKVVLSAGQPRFQNQPVTANAKILIADDSYNLRQSLRQILELQSFTIYEAHDGMEALEYILEQPPDLLLLDIEMPNLNGFDLLSIIRANPLLSRLKIILLTSRSSEKHRQRALELGARDYLIKPCSQDVLLDRVQTVLAS
jgi:chemosensory pili system protein ChpA (sensor histidine kinase/response regulator)